MVLNVCPNLCLEGHWLFLGSSVLPKSCMPVVEGACAMPLAASSSSSSCKMILRPYNLL